MTLPHVLTTLPQFAVNQACTRLGETDLPAMSRAILARPAARLATGELAGWRGLVARLVARDSLVLAGLCFLVLVQNAPFLTLPHYWDSLTFVAQAQYIRTHGFAPDVPVAEDFGHPPLVQELVALVWSAVGQTPLAAHLTMVAFAAAALCFTFRLGARLFDRETGAVAALLLAFYPLFWASGTHVLLDLPAAAFGVLALDLLVRGRPVGYVLAASAAVLCKTTAVVLVPPVLLYVALNQGPPAPGGPQAAAAGRRSSVRRLVVRLALHALPVAVAAAWLGYHYARTGWLTVPDNSGQLDVPAGLSAGQLVLGYLPAALFGPDGVLRTLGWMVWAYFGRTFLVGALTLAVAWYALRGRRERPFGPVPNGVLLVGPIVCQLIVMAVTVQLHRYLLLVYPLFFILAARAIWGLVRRPALVAVCVAAALVVFSVGWRWSVFGYELGSPSTAAFADFVATHVEAAAWLERQYPDKVVLAGWPQYVELAMTLQGYVRRPFRIVAYAPYARHVERIRGLGGRPFVEVDELTDDDFDLLYYSDRTGFGPELARLEAIVQKYRLPVVAEFRQGRDRTVIYGNPKRGTESP